MKKVLLFDIDGTLLLSGGAGTAAFNKAFKDVFDVDNAYEGVQPHGKTDPLIIGEIARRVLGRELDSEEFTELKSSYLSHFTFQVKNSPRFQVLNGALELCKTLSTYEEFVLGIQTGNFEQSARLKLETGKLDGYFSFGGFGCDSYDRTTLVNSAITRAKKHLQIDEISPENVYVIGDAVQDVVAGRAVGATTIAVLTGKDGREELSKHGPHHIFDDLSKVERVLEILLK